MERGGKQGGVESGEEWKVERGGKQGGVESGEGWKEHKLAREGEPGRNQEA